MVSHPSVEQALDYLTARQDQVHSDGMTKSTTAQVFLLLNSVVRRLKNHGVIRTEALHQQDKERTSKNSEKYCAS